VRKSDVILSVFAVLIVSGLFAKGILFLWRGEVASNVKTALKK